MKESIKNLRNGLLFGIGASFIIVVSLIIYSKARQTTNPTTSDDGQGMYTTAGGTLTAAKWNNLVNRSAFRVYLGSSQTISAATRTKLYMNSKEFDTNNEFDTSTYRFTPKRAGKYILSAFSYFNAIPTWYWGYISIYKNWSIYAYGTFASNWGATWTISSIETLVEANGSTDYFEVYARSNKSGGASLNPWNNYTFLQWYRVE